MKKNGCKVKISRLNCKKKEKETPRERLCRRSASVKKPCIIKKSPNNALTGKDSKRFRKAKPIVLIETTITRKEITTKTQTFQKTGFTPLEQAVPPRKRANSTST